jgi:predicted glycosyltransferase
MNILFHLGHPSHYHVFKNVIKTLKEKGETISIVINTKDILEDLLKGSSLDYHNILPVRRKSKKKISALTRLLVQDINLLKFCLKNKPDILIGSSVAISHIGKILNIPSFYVGEDDYSVVPLSSKLSLPFATLIISPGVCSKGKWDSKKISYDGYQKLAYLHPNNFTPEKEIVEKYFSSEKIYFLLRFSNLDAHHDSGIRGINAAIAQKLIDILKEKGDIYITSERDLEPQFEHYRLNINPLDIHHVMAYATMYIGDSQSMAVEAAMLGVPSLRFNDFAGKIRVLEELEHTYQLTYGIKSQYPDQLYSKITELLNSENLKEEFQQRRKKMLKEKIDVAAFMTWFIANYPESKEIMRTNPDYQYNFT